MTTETQNCCKGKTAIGSKLDESRFGLAVDPLLAFVDKDGAVKTTTKDLQHGVSSQNDSVS